MKRIKHFIDPKRWRSFGIYLLKTFLKKVDGSEAIIDQWEIEQFMYRYITCKDCVEKGECIHNDCRCKMPERAHVRTDFCPILKWGPFLDKDRWSSFKERNKIEFIIKKSKNV